MPTVPVHTKRIKTRCPERPIAVNAKSKNSAYAEYCRGLNADDLHQDALDAMRVALATHDDPMIKHLEIPTEVTDQLVAYATGTKDLASNDDQPDTATKAQLALGEAKKKLTETVTGILGTSDGVQHSIINPAIRAYTASVSSDLNLAG